LITTDPDPRATAREFGRQGAAKRWGEHGRILRLDHLDPVTAQIIKSILTARKNAQEAEASADKA
jgi:hypothetical protein